VEGVAKADAIVSLHHASVLEGPRMNGPQGIAASFEERLAAGSRSTSFKHALYW
jgi:hypothetical protein